MRTRVKSNGYNISTLLRSTPMKASLLLVGMFVTTLVGAQIRTATPDALKTPSGKMQVSPTTHIGDATAVDPQFQLLRKQISDLKRQQAMQQGEIAHLHTCVAELVKAIKSNRGMSHLGAPMGGSSATQAGSSKIGEPMNGSPGLMKSGTVGGPMGNGNQLDNHVATAAPSPARADLTRCD